MMPKKPDPARIVITTNASSGRNFTSSIKKSCRYTSKMPHGMLPGNAWRRMSMLVLDDVTDVTLAGEISSGWYSYPDSR